MAPAGLGVFVADVAASKGDDYAFVLDGGTALPDPATRWQPDGLRGPSRVWIPDASPAPFTSPALRDLVVYELHI
jgi:maltooligosyltrehalose trehalohydrolase